MAHPRTARRRLPDSYRASCGRQPRDTNADVWPAYTCWALHGRTIDPDMPATVCAAAAVDAEVPATDIWGEHAPFVPTDRGRASAQRTDAGFVEIADAGQLPCLDRPEQTARSILAALDTGAGLR